MRRISAVILSAALVITLGCGKAGYEKRLEQTLAQLQYIQRLDAKLAPAPTDAQFKDFPMYIRPPKGLTLSSNFVMSADLPAGQYDLAASFIGDGEEAGRSLHVLGRRKTAKKAAPKAKAAEGEAAQPEAAPRGPFDDDLITLLSSVYGASEALQTSPSRWPLEKKRTNEFRRQIFTASNNNIVSVYVYKKAPYEVALIWDVPADKAKDSSVRVPRELTLESFAVGRKAVSYLGGGASPSSGSGEESSEGSTPL